MKLNERQKMCNSCDGRIPLDANLCPYCAAEQGSSSQVYLQHKSIQESLTSLYPPPYAAKQTQPVKDQSFKTPTHLQEPMSDKRFQHASPQNTSSIHINTAEEQSPAEDKSSFWSLLLLSIGANLLVLGLLQLFFSDNGALTLQWDSHYWFIYCLASLPLCYFGFKKVNSNN